MKKIYRWMFARQDIFPISLLFELVTVIMIAALLELYRDGTLRKLIEE